MSDDRAIVYEEDGRIIYRASSFGTCDRALVAARLGYPSSPPPEALQRVFDGGNQAEEWYTANHPVQGAQTELRLDIPDTDPPVSIVGHVDGFEGDVGWYVVEIKSQSPEMYDRWNEGLWTTDDLWMKYAWQTSVYQWAFQTDPLRRYPAGLEVVRVRRPDDNNPDYQFSSRFYEIPFHPLSEIYARVHHLEELAATSTLPPCNKGEVWGCPYYQLHEGPELVEDKELDRVCKGLKAAQLSEKFAKEEVGRWKDRVKEVLGGRTEISTTGGYSVKLTTFQTKERYTPAGEQTRLTVTETK